MKKKINIYILFFNNKDVCNDFYYKDIVYVIT